MLISKMDELIEKLGTHITKQSYPIDFSNISGFPNFGDGEKVLYKWRPVFHGNSDVKSFLEFLTDFNALYEDTMMQVFVSSLQGDFYFCFYKGLPNKCITSLSSFLWIFLKQWHDGRGSMKGLEKLLEAIFTFYLPNIEYHKEEPPHLTTVKSIEYLELQLDYFSKNDDSCISHLHSKEKFTEIPEEPLIENMVIDLPHVSMVCNVEDLECPRDHLSNNDNIFSDWHQDEIITEIDTYEEIHNDYKMCDDTSPCSSHGAEGWESWVPCDIFETQLFEEDCFEQNDECSQGLDTSDEASLISDIDGDDDYWTFIENPTYDTFENIFENPIYDMSTEESVYSKTYESH